MKKNFQHRLKYLKDYIKVFIMYFHKSRYNGKVFCIGFNKTGTSSLAKSLMILGFKHGTYNKIIWKKYYKNNEISKILKYTAKFESLDDLPWLKEDMIPILDKTFPNSKFIYLTRDEESWKKSLYTWSYNKFGEHADTDKSVKEFRDHSKFIKDYFKDRSKEEFITLDIKDPKGFKKLANFLGKEYYHDNFPHFNRSN